jgi:hypothetical protein
VIGQTTSPKFSYVLASVPGQPLTLPTLNLLKTSGHQIQVDYAPVSDNGGSAVLSYELQVYQNQHWVTITGGLNQFSLLTSFVYTNVT